jgi:hypothetical protein
VLGWDMWWEDGDFFLQGPEWKVSWIGTFVDSDYGVACDGCLDIRKGGLSGKKGGRYEF